MNQGDYLRRQKIFQGTHHHALREVLREICVLISGRFASGPEAREEPHKGIGMRVVGSAR